MNIQPTFLNFCPSLFLVIFLLACQSEETQQPTPDPRPNILLIMADDMGYSDLGCYGSEIRTPNLDGLAKSGVAFRHFYNTARCCPTRAALLTGLYPHEAGMGAMVSNINSNPQPGPYQGYLNDQCLTLAELLKPAGYATYMSGKWHVGEKPEYWPTKRGFDKYFGLISGASSYYEVITDQPRVRQMAYNGQPWTPPEEGFYMTDALSDSAASFLGQHLSQKDEPFFMYLAYTAPHWPLHALEEDIIHYQGRYDDGWEALREERYLRMQKEGMIDTSFQLPPWEEGVPEWNQRDTSLHWERRMEVYAAMIDRMDQGLGRIFDTLQAHNVWDNTLVIFLSDNGGSPESITGRSLNDPTVEIGLPGSYAAYRKPWAIASNTPFRRYKRWVAEGGIASPLLMHWPEGIDATDERVDTYAHVVDIYPTLAELAQATYSDSVRALRGTNLLPIIRGEVEDTGRPLFWEHIGHQAMRQGKWKMVSKAPEYQWALYDMQQDPTELNDVSEDFPKVLKQMGQTYKQWSEEVGVQKRDG